MKVGNHNYRLFMYDLKKQAQKWFTKIALEIRENVLEL
jgi:hypothetical protein